MSLLKVLHWQRSYIECNNKDNWFSTIEKEVSYQIMFIKNSCYSFLENCLMFFYFDEGYIGWNRVKIIYPP